MCLCKVADAVKHKMQLCQLEIIAADTKAYGADDFPVVCLQART